MQMILQEWIPSQLMRQGSVRDALLSLADSLESDPDSVKKCRIRGCKVSWCKTSRCVRMYVSDTVRFC